MRIISDVKPRLKLQKTEALVYDQGYTYDEASLTYDSAVAYGGLYGNDITPSIVMAKADKSNMRFINDLPNTLSVRLLVRGQSMGLLLALTYPSTQVIFL